MNKLYTDLPCINFKRNNSKPGLSSSVINNCDFLLASASCITASFPYFLVNMTGSTKASDNSSGQCSFKNFFILIADICIPDQQIPRFLSVQYTVVTTFLRLIFPLSFIYFQYHFPRCSPMGKDFRLLVRWDMLFMYSVEIRLPISGNDCVNKNHEN